jgi:hypothetical protein
MTEGLLISRRTKQQLYEKFLADPTEPARALYKNFSKIYFKTVCAAKKLHYSNLLTENAKNPKKTWDTFNEILGRGRPCESVEKIVINGQDVTDPVQIATGFNTFFTRPLFVQHQILPLNELILYSKMKFMHNYMFGNVPPSFFDMWLTNREKNNIRVLRNADDLFCSPT